MRRGSVHGSPGGGRPLAMMIALMMVMMAFATFATPVSGADPLDPMIEIAGDLNLAAAADSGSGTPSDPYVIEGRTINVTATSNVNAISIIGTNAHLIIRDCLLESGGPSTHVYDGNGIYIQNCRNVTIENVTAEYNTVSGIMLDNSINITVIDCHSGLNGLSATGTYGNGIMVQTCQDVMVSDCSFYDSRTSGVIFYRNYDVDPSVNVTISRCQMSGNGVGVRDQSNLIDDLTVENCTISDYSYSGFFMNTNYGDRKTGWVIRDNLIENGDLLATNGAMPLDGLTGAIIEGNVVVHTYSSHYNQIISITNCDNTTVRDCTVVDNIGMPFKSVTSQNITFSDSVLSNCTQAAVKVDNSVDVTVEDLDISGSVDEGVEVFDSIRVLIEGCDIIDNGGDGIYVAEDPNTGIDFYGLRISNCSLVRNNYGVYITNHAEFVTVVNNSFIDNNASSLAVTDLQARDDGVNCSWNSSEGGNYWSDWTGPDDDHDGFVDVPYDIYGSAGSRDMLPLADPEDVPPEVVITSPVDGATINTTDVTVEWQAWDNESGLDHIDVIVDSESPLDVGLNMSIALSLSEGAHTVVVTAYDNETNNGSDAVAFTIALPTAPGVPTGLGATPLNSSVSLSWSVPSDGGSPITMYHVYRGLNLTSLVEVGTSASASYMDNGLTNGVTYHYAVSAENAIGESGMSDTIEATPIAVPNAPSGLEVEANGTSAELSWSVPYDGGSPIDHYNVYRADDSATFTQVGQSNSTTFTDGTLDKGVVYTYAVGAVNTWGEGPMSENVSITILTVPDVPTSPSAVMNGSGIWISWSAPVDDGGAPIEGYGVYRAIGDVEMTLLANVTGTSYQDDDATAGVTYRYAVSALNSEGEGPMSATVNGTYVTVPGAPTSLIVTVEGSGLGLSWSAPVDDGGAAIEGYDVYRAIDDGEMTLLANVTGTSYQDDDATASVAYRYAVSAFNSEGEGAMSAIVNGTYVTVPGMPIGLEATVSDDDVTLDWESPGDDGGSTITGYVVHYGTTTSLGQTVNVDGTTHTFAGLDPGTYHFAVSAVNAIGEGDMTGIVSADLSSTPSAPTSLEGENGDGGVTLTWSAPSNDGGSSIGSYNVYRSEGDGDYSLIGNSTSTSYIDSEVGEGNTYHYVVKAVNSEGEGTSSASVTIDVGTTNDGLDWYVYAIPLIVVALLLALLLIMRRRKDGESEE